jgi:hypothetical protein
MNAIEVLFVAQFFIFLIIFCIKMWNLFKGSQWINTAGIWFTFILGIIVSSVGQLTALVDAGNNIIFSVLLQLQYMVFGLFVIFHVAEVLLDLGWVGTRAVGAHKSLDEGKRR